MIVCVCHRLNCKSVKEAISAGARTPDCVQAHHGREFNCGCCESTISDMIADEMVEAEAASHTVAAE